MENSMKTKKVFEFEELSLHVLTVRYCKFPFLTGIIFKDNCICFPKWREDNDFDVYLGFIPNLT